MESIELLKTLSNAFGVSGREEPVKKTIQEIVEPLVDEIRTDSLGNFIATKHGQGKKSLMLDAHMDEIGFMINYIDDDGYLGFVPLGSWDQRILPSHRMEVLCEDETTVTGVIGTVPPHIQDEEDRKSVIDMEDLFLDVGANSRGEVKELGIKVGSFATIHYPFRQLNDNYVLGKAFDDRAGCAAVIKVLEELKDHKLDATLVANFAICEETGLRGARTAAYQINPDVALALEGTIGADIPGVEEKRQPVTLGKGPAITLADKSIVVKKNLTDALVNLAQEKGISYQFKRPAFGGTDAGAIHLSREGVIAGVLSVPCRYIHSPNSTLRLDDFRETVSLTAEFVKEFPGTVK
ncbi:MAG: M42 family metallopeptidase [Candidatus Bipolaricaulota bacterium]